MVWSQEIAAAYNLGLEDGRAGRHARLDQQFNAAYMQGYLHGQQERI